MRKVLNVGLGVLTASFLTGCVPLYEQDPTPQYRQVAAKPTISVFRFIGRSQDKVGRGFQATPNGEPDGQFRVQIDPRGLQRRLTGFLLYTSDARGNRVYSTQAAQSWSTVGEGWFLGVETGGKRLNPSADSAVSHLIEGTTEFDLFADGASAFVRGEYATVVVRFSDGSRIAAVTRIE